MNTILETKRTYLRELTENDYDDLCEILKDPEAMYAYEHAFSDDEARTWLNKQLNRYQDYGFGLWAVIEKTSGVFLGQAGLTMQDVDGIQELEIGYLFKRKNWNQGYATEVAIACKDYAFNVLKRNRVVTIIRDINYRSQKVAERVGLKREKQFIKHYYKMDMPHYLYVIEKNH